MFTLVSTRFNNETFQENFHYRERKGITCIYCSPQPMSPKIGIDTLVVVVEMNNSKNQMEGMGLIKNLPETSGCYHVYDTRNFNRYIFKGDYRISRDELVRNDEKLVEILDQLLFKGKTHLKRGSGFTTIPEKLLNHPKWENINIKQWIKTIFIEKYVNNLEIK
jgi:hypothetical protein